MRKHKYAGTGCGCGPKRECPLHCLERWMKQPISTIRKPKPLTPDQLAEAQKKMRALEHEVFGRFLI